MAYMLNPIFQISPCVVSNKLEPCDKVKSYLCPIPGELMPLAEGTALSRSVRYPIDNFRNPASSAIFISVDPTIWRNIPVTTIRREA